MKKVLKIVAALVLLVIIAGAIALWQIDRIAKSAVERGGTYALGTDVTVASLDLSLLAGDVEMDGLGVKNPEGFEAEQFITTGRLMVDTEPGSLRTDTIVIPLIELETMTITIEQKDGEKNYQPILDRLKELQGPEDPDAPPSETKYRIDRLVIGEVIAEVNVPPLGKTTVRVPRIELTDLTQDNAQGVALSAVFERVTPAILAAVGQTIFAQGGDLAKAIGGGLLEGTADLGGVAKDLVGQATAGVGQLLEEGVGGVVEGSDELLKKSADELGEGAGRILEDAGGALEEGAKGVGEGLRGILGGDRDDQ